MTPVYEVYISRTDRVRPTDQRPTSQISKFRMAISLEGVIRFTSCLVLGGVFGVCGSNSAISSWTKFNRYVGENNARGVIRLVTI